MNTQKIKEIIKIPYYYLIAIATGIATIHLLLISQANESSDEIIFTLLPWLGLIILLWQKKDKIELNSDYISSIIGLILISLILTKSVNLFWFETSFIKLIPLLGIIGLFLIASGIKGLKNYAREIIVITIIAIPTDSLERIINHLFEVNILTAKMATLFLWYSGIKVSNEGAMLNFTDASVFVDYPCTGVGSILILIKLSILGICVFNNHRKTQIFLIIISIIIGFFLGVIRASILALIVKNEVLFNYWHGDDGGSIFAMLSMAIFGLIYNFIVPKLEMQKSNSVEWVSGSVTRQNLE